MLYETTEEQGFSDFYFSACYTNHSCDPHVHSHMEFVLVLQGELTLFVDNRAYTVSAGSLAIISPYEVHKYQSPLPSQCYILACPPEYIPEFRQILRNQIFSPPIALYAADTAALLPEMVRLCAGGNCIEQGPQSSFKKKALLYCCLSDLLRSSSLEKRTSQELDLYRSAVMYISNHYTQKLELPAVAKELGVSTSHLSRVLSSRGGLGFSNLIGSLRSYEASRLLLQTDLTISQIALESGFGCIRSFNRVFQKQFHCLPREFRTTHL